MARVGSVRLSPLTKLALLAVAVAAVRFAVAVQVRTPLAYPDEYTHATLARSIVDGTFARVRGDFGIFIAYLGPLLMSPAWLVDDVDVAYRLSQGLGAVAFAAAAFPAYVLARRVGVSSNGALLVAVLTLVCSGGTFTVGLLSEPYAYPLFLLAVIAAVDAIAAPTVTRQLAVLAAALALVLVGGAQFAVFGGAYVVASYLAGRRPPRQFVREQAVVLASTAIVGAILLVYSITSGFGPLAGIAARVRASNFSISELGAWFVVDLFVLAVASGWVTVPAAVLGFRSLIRSDDPRQRAFAVFSIVLLVGHVFEAAKFGVDENSLLERYAYYVVPLVVIAFVWVFESTRPKRPLYAAVAYAAAGAALLLPLTSTFKNAAFTQSPTLLGLTEFTIGDRPAVLWWAPVLAALAGATALRGPVGRRGLVALALVVCVVTSAGSSWFFVRYSRQADTPRAHVPAGATLLTWSGAERFALMKTLFWNREVTRVLTFDPGPEYGIPLVHARFVPGEGFVAIDGTRLRGPFIIGSETFAVVGGVAANDSSALTTLRGTPTLLAFGWHRRVGYLGSSGRIYVTGESTPTRVTLTLRSPVGVKAMRFRCRRGFDRTIEVAARPTSIVIPVPRGALQSCSFNMVLGTLETVGGHPVSVGSIETPGGFLVSVRVALARTRSSPSSG